MVTQSYIAPPTISSRNKSLVSLRESLQEGFLEHNINNKSQSTLLSVIQPLAERKPIVSPNPSSNDLRHHLTMAFEEQTKEQEETTSPRPLKKRKIELLATQAEGPATAAASIALAKANEQEAIAIRKRKALAAKLRARGVSRKLVLKPSDFAQSVFCKNRTAVEIPRFPEPSEADLEIHAKHSHVLYNYVRKGTDLEGFKKCVRGLQKTYHERQTKDETEAEQYQQPFRCSNRFGESLMHLACRRGRTEMVRFLVEELPGGTPSQMLSIQDDCHKTPLHDACWTPSPNFELVELILEHAPEQVMMQDVRGNTPFDYVRKEDYALWLRFLWERRSLLGAARANASSAAEQLPSN